MKVKCWDCRYCQIDNGHRCKLSNNLDKFYDYSLLHVNRECSDFVHKPKRGEKGYIRPEYQFRCALYAILKIEFAEYLPSFTFSWDGLKFTDRQVARMKKAGCFNPGTPDMDFSYPTENYPGLKMELKPEGTQLKRKDGLYLSKMNEQHNRLLYFRDLGYHTGFNSIDESYACGTDGVKEILREYLKPEDNI